MLQMNPSTNCPHCGAKIYDRNMYGLIFDCGSTLYNPAVAKSHVHDLCREREARQKAKKDLETALIVLKCSKNSLLKTRENAQHEIERLTQELIASKESEAGWKTEWEKADIRRNESEAENQKLRELLEGALWELEKSPFNTPKLTAFTAHRLADRYREQLNQLTK